MNESYKELLVKKERTWKDKILYNVCFTLAVFAGIMTLLTMSAIFLAAAVVLGILTYFVNQWTNIEYEYLYLDREITVDKIMAQTKRKRLVTLQVDKIEILAPEKSYQLDSYKHRDVKVTDYSVGRDLEDQKLYVMYYEGSQKYLLNLTEDFAKTVKGMAPRKVFLD